MPNQTDFSMPGPQFNGSESLWRSWVKRNYQKITIGLIIVLVAIGGFSFYKRYQQRANLLGPDLEKITVESKNSQLETSNPAPATTAKDIENNEPNLTPATAPTVAVKDDRIIVSPAPGNGITHLARQALKEYLKDKPELASKLKPQQKIYIEDYLRKHITDPPPVLQMTDSISFSTGLLDDAINESLELTDSQLQNLQKYVPLVPSLNY